MVADFNKPFFLYVDSSNVAIGAALMQEDNVGEHKPVAYYSKKLNQAQRNYSTPDKEALALVLAVRAFRIYMSGHVIVYTDHQPLVFMNRMATSNQRLLRWTLEMQSYDLEIKHISGKKNVLADYLSRPCILDENTAVRFCCRLPDGGESSKVGVNFQDQSASAADKSHNSCSSFGIYSAYCEH
jgi:hypothetical protein